MLENKTQRAMQLLLRLLQKSAEGGVSFDELCEEFDDCESDGVERRIHRYICDVKVAAEPLGYELTTPGKGNRQGKYSLKPPEASQDSERELLLTILDLEAKEKKRFSRPNSVGKKSSSVIYNQAMQFRRMEEYVRKMRERVIMIDKASYIDEKPANHLEECMAAVENQQQLQIFYHAKYRDVLPLGLVSLDEKWYLFTVSTNYEDYRLFRVDKIRGLIKREKTFEYPAEFSLREHFKNAWQMFSSDSGERVVVVLRVTGNTTEEFELLRFHVSQVNERNDDGSLTVRMSVPSWRGMIGWILKWGEFVEVLEPADLRVTVAEIVGRMSGKYELSHRVAEPQRRVE